MYEQVAVPIFEKVKNAENIVLKVFTRMIQKYSGNNCKQHGAIYIGLDETVFN